MRGNFEIPYNKLHPHLSPGDSLPLRGRIEERGNSYTIKLWQSV